MAEWRQSARTPHRYAWAVLVRTDDWKWGTTSTLESSMVRCKYNVEGLPGKHVNWHRCRHALVGKTVATRASNHRERER